MELLLVLELYGLRVYERAIFSVRERNIMGGIERERERDRNRETDLSVQTHMRAHIHTCIYLKPARNPSWLGNFRDLHVAYGLFLHSQNIDSKDYSFLLLDLSLARTLFAT